MLYGSNLIIEIFKTFICCKIYSQSFLGTIDFCFYFSFWDFQNFRLLCLTVILSETLAQEVGSETITSLGTKPVMNQGDESQTTTTETSEASLVEHNVLQLDPVM